MRVYLLVLCIVLSSISVKAQKSQLTLQNLISFVNIDISDINENISKKSWQFYRNDNSTYDRAQTIWAYDFDKIDSTALSWLWVQTRKGYLNVVKFQCQSPSNYTSIMEDLKKLGVKKNYTSLKDKDAIETLYLGNTYKYKVVTMDKMHIIEVSNRVSERKRLINDILHAPNDNPVDTLTAEN